MNEEASATATSEAGGGDAAAEPQRSNARLLLLLLLLAVACGALYWDRKVARPTSEKMSKVLEQASDERSSSTKPQLTQEEVSELLGRQAASSTDGEHYLIEKFRWLGGLPWKSYDINVVYMKTSEGPRFHTAYYMSEPDEQMLPGYKPPAPDPNAPQPAGADPGAMTPDMLSGEAIGTGGPDGQRPSPEALVARVFEENDADKDDNLSAEEIAGIEQERRRTMVLESDTNGDGQVGREELTAAVTERFASGGGPGGRGGRGGRGGSGEPGPDADGGGRPKRPELQP